MNTLKDKNETFFEKLKNGLTFIQNNIRELKELADNDFERNSSDLSTQSLEQLKEFEQSILDTNNEIKHFNNIINSEELNLNDIENEFINLKAKLTDFEVNMNLKSFGYNEWCEPESKFKDTNDQSIENNTQFNDEKYLIANERRQALSSAKTRSRSLRATFKISNGSNNNIYNIGSSREKVNLDLETPQPEGNRRIRSCHLFEQSDTSDNNNEDYNFNAIAIAAGDNELGAHLTQSAKFEKPKINNNISRQTALFANYAKKKDDLAESLAQLQMQQQQRQQAQYYRQQQHQQQQHKRTFQKHQQFHKYQSNENVSIDSITYQSSNVSMDHFNNLSADISSNTCNQQKFHEQTIEFTPGLKTSVNAANTVAAAIIDKRFASINFNDKKLNFYQTERITPEQPIVTPRPVTVKKRMTGTPEKPVSIINDNMKAAFLAQFRK